MKKAQINTVVVMSIVIIIALLLIIIGSKIFETYSKKGEIEVCKLSVLTQSKLEITGTSPLSLNCKRRFIDIYDTKVQTGYDPDKTKAIDVSINGVLKDKFETLNNDIVSYIVAEEMSNCWYQFGEAKTEIFPNDEKVTEAIGTSDDDICFICSEMEFIDIKNEQYSGLMNYLKNNYPKDKKYTYWEYLNQKSLSEHTLTKYIDDCNKDTINDLWNNEPFVFKSDETYAIIFYKDYDEPDDIMDPIINTIQGPESERCDASGGKSGYFVLVLPTTNIDKICEKQVS